MVLATSAKQVDPSLGDGPGCQRVEAMALFSFAQATEPCGWELTAGHAASISKAFLTDALPVDGLVVASNAEAAPNLFTKGSVLLSPLAC